VTGTIQREQQLLPSVEQFLRREPSLLVDGQWLPARDGDTFDTYNPATGQRLASVASGKRADIDLAVAAARRAFAHDAPWMRMPPSQRGRLIWLLADLIDEHTEQLAQLETLDQGKPLAVSRTADIPGSAETFRYMAGWATKIEGRTVPIGAPGSFLAYTRREPIGVVGQIVPWNFPLAMAAWKVAPALAAGCTVVLKPAEQTSLTALRLGELVMEAGFPPGVVNVVTGFGPTAGAALTEHPDVDKIAFTGSTPVGKQIVHASTVNLKRLSLELGGKSPSIIMADADIQAAVAGMSRGAFANAGQVCTSGSRLYVHAAVYDEVAAALAEQAAAIKVGAGMTPGNDMGPVVSQEQLERVMSYLDSGRAEGGEMLVGGQRIGQTGYFVEPTIFVSTRPDMRIVREEIFGPVATLTRFSDTEDLITQANDSIFGLAAEIWTRDVSTAHRLAGRLEAGTVWVNGRSMDIALPFGGYKQSGWGREKGEQGVDLYTQTKTVVIHV
jgi:phenylacetaldehyde dehydrogenase